MLRVYLPRTPAIVREDVLVQPVNLPTPVTGRKRSSSPIDPRYPSG
ncbi:MAG TPA: hypothetical protein VKT77_22565 [Chthonomonadaceae bacterium]|nr:hypothetical protein [Chthonomonadaceae bacterium]